MLLLDLHYKIHREQYDRQFSSLASITHQTHWTKAACVGLFWLHGSSVLDMRSKRGMMMLLDLHFKTYWEQHDRQSSSLATTTHQTLDKTRPCSVDLWSSHR